MCGLCGFITKDRKKPATSIRQLRAMLLECSSRGTDATGIFWEEKDDYKLFKAPIEASEFSKHIPWDKIIKSPICIMHTRSVTQGTPTVFTNNHPLQQNNYILAHNGVILNSDDFVEKDVCDSLAILEALRLSTNGIGALSFKIISDALYSISGSIAFSLFETNSRQLFLLSAGNPLIIGQKENTIFWASTFNIMRPVRAAMISDMITDYLVLIKDTYMKGKKIALLPRLASNAYTGNWVTYDSKTKTYKVKDNSDINKKKQICETRERLGSYSQQSCIGDNADNTEESFIDKVYRTTMAQIDEEMDCICF